MIPEEKLQELKERIDIVDLVGRYVGLKRAGKNFAACCPFHSERTPSFYVNPERRSYKCFGCGVWGTGIDFVMQMRARASSRPVASSPSSTGCSCPSGLKDHTSTPSRTSATRPTRSTRAAAELYREILLHGEEGQLGRLYQERGHHRRDRRGLPARLRARTRRGRLGPPHHPPQRKGLSLPLAEKLGLVARSERTDNVYDKFRGR
jgi:DNA primase